MAIPSINCDTVLQLVYQWPSQATVCPDSRSADSLEPPSAKAAMLLHVLGLLATTQSLANEERLDLLAAV